MKKINTKPAQGDGRIVSLLNYCALGHVGILVTSGTSSVNSPTGQVNTVSSVVVCTRCGAQISKVN